MPKKSDSFQVDAAELRAEIRAIEQSVEAAKARFDRSVRLAADALAQLEKQQKTSASRSPKGATADELANRLAKAKRNATRVEAEGKESLSALKKQSNISLKVLRRRLKLVEEKIAARH